ncbi:MAG: helix-turn-helix transcriptional regulator [Firmicutes bacterium]|nr:helix-turn-helix transcriptional regulator [Bacillota bacterium]
MVLDVFAKRLRAYRKLKSLTQEEFAQAMGVSVAVAGGWERGTRTPTDQQVRSMEELFQVNRKELGLDLLYGGEMT